MKPKAPALLMLVGGLIFLFGDKLPNASSLFSLGTRPIAADGFRVMIVYDDASLSEVPESQKAVLFSATVREFLSANCEQSDGNPDYRIVTTHADFSVDLEHWKNAFDRPRKSLPWILINGKSHGGFDGPLPKSVESTLSLLRKYAGVKS